MAIELAEPAPNGRKDAPPFGRLSAFTAHAQHELRDDAGLVAVVERPDLLPGAALRLSLCWNVLRNVPTSKLQVADQIDISDFLSGSGVEERVRLQAERDGAMASLSLRGAEVAGLKAQRAELLKALKEAIEHEHNPFEPNNQSARQSRWTALVKKIEGAMR